MTREQREQVRAALEEIRRVALSTIGYDSVQIGSLVESDLCDIREFAAAALAALPSPEECEREQREAAACRWRPIRTAPRDGREVILLTVEGYVVRACWRAGPDPDAGFTWLAMDDEYPLSWDDGVCWASNSDERPSAQPTHWMPFPIEAAQKGGAL